jgi:hypothetical protein
MVAYSFNKRFVDPVRVGLSRISLSFDCPPKRQTIRAIGRRRHARPGETLQLYHGLRTRQCFKIGDARCVETLPIVIKVPLDDVWLAVKIGDAEEVAADDTFARDDGFACIEDMWLFWRKEHPDDRIFKGLLIRWEPF